jgi:hypothetical protein
MNAEDRARYLWRRSFELTALPEKLLERLRER